MSERISSQSTDPPRRICGPEDDRTEEIPHATAPATTSSSRDRMVSEALPDWDRVPNACEANASVAAQMAVESGICVEGSAGASTNAARTAERDLRAGPYVTAGRTHDGKSEFSSAAVLHGTTAEGVAGEIASVSIQGGEQTEVQATAVRLGVRGQNADATIEAFTASAHIGIENSDGSRGFNAGASATAAGAEVTVKRDGSSATIGVVAGAGGEAHVGLRDADGDGRVELCVRLGAMFLIAGGCYESPVVIRP
jgi:hypothetical protein